MTDMLTASYGLANSPNSQVSATGAAWLPGATPEGSLILKAVTEALCPRALIATHRSQSVTLGSDRTGSVCSGGLSKGCGR